MTSRIVSEISYPSSAAIGGNYSNDDRTLTGENFTVGGDTTITNCDVLLATGTPQDSINLTWDNDATITGTQGSLIFGSMMQAPVMDVATVSSGATFPSGHVLQVKNSYVNAASNVFAVSSEPSGTSGGQNFVAPSTPLSVNITPKASGNKFLLMCNFTYGMNADTTAMFVIKRTAPTVAYSSGVADTSGDARTASFVGVHGNNSGYKMGASIHWLDTSVSDAEHIYSLFGGHNGTGSVVYLGGTHANYVGGSTLTVMEIAG